MSDDQKIPGPYDDDDEQLNERDRPDDSGDEILTTGHDMLLLDMREYFTNWKNAHELTGTVDIERASPNSFILNIRRCEGLKPKNKRRSIFIDTFYDLFDELRIENTVLNRSWLVFFTEFKNVKKVTFKSVSTLISDLKPNTFPELKSVVLNNISIDELPGWVKIKDTIRELDVSKTRIITLPDTTLKNLTALSVSETPISELPEIKSGRAENLNFLNIARTSIKAIPECYLGPALETLLAGQRAVDKIDELKQLDKLKTLSLAGLKIESLPAEVSFVETLETLDLSSTKLKELPQWLIRADNLDYLGLSNLFLDTLDEKIAKKLFLDKEMKVHKGALKWKVSSAGAAPGPENEAGVYTSGLRMRDMDVRYLQLDDKKFLRAYYSEPREANHEIQVIFCGETGPGSRQLISDLLGERDLSALQNAVGFLKAESRILEDSSGRSLLPRNAQMSYLLLAAEDAYQAAHHLFVGDSNLYIVFLDVTKTDTISQTALKWARFAELYSPWSQVLFVVNFSRDKRDLHFIRQLPPVSGLHIPLHAIEGLPASSDDTQEIIDYEEWLDYEDTEEPIEYEKRFDDIVKKIADIIKDMPEYTKFVPKSWKNARSHLHSLLDLNGVVSQKEYESILSLYKIEDESVKRQLVQWFGETGVCIVEKRREAYQFERLFSPAKTAVAAYSALVLSGKGKSDGFIKENTLLRYLNDLDIPANWLYRITDVTNALDMLHRSGLCALRPDKRGGTAYYFPLHGRSPGQEDQKASYWMNLWHGLKIDDLEFDENTVHYVMEFDYLPNALICAIIVEIFSRTLNISYRPADWGRTVFFGRDSAFYSPGSGDNWFVIAGRPGINGRIHIHASKHDSGEGGAAGESYAPHLLKAARDVFGYIHGNVWQNINIFVDIQKDDMSELVSLDEIRGYNKAGIKEMLIPSMNSPITISEVVKDYYLTEEL